MRRIFPTFNDSEGKWAFRPLIIPNVALALWIGVAYIQGDPRRTQTPSFEQARQVADITNWGWMFLVGGLGLFVTMWIADSLYLRVALFLGGVIYSWWGFLFMLGILHVPYSSLNAPVLYWFIAYMHFIAAALTRRPDMK